MLPKKFFDIFNFKSQIVPEDPLLWLSERSQIADLKFEKFSGGCVERVTPVPIPNTEVKPLGADGTARATVWESRKPPGLFMKSPLKIFLSGLFISKSQNCALSKL